MQKNLAARMGRWSAEHRKLAIGGWIAFVVLSLVIGGMVGVKKPADENDRVGDSGRAMSLVDDHFPTQNDENVLVQARLGGHATDPAVRAAVAQTMAAVSKSPRVYDVESPYRHADHVAKDGRSVLVTFKLHGTQTEAENAIQPIVDSVHRVARANPAVYVGEFGSASASKALSKAFSDDFQKAEKLSLPITLVILLLAFGALVAAGVPLLLGLTAVVGHARAVGAAEPARPARTEPSTRSCCSSAWRSASTTRSSTCAASGRSARKGASKPEALDDRRRHVRPRRADLRLHRHGRHGRHVPRRADSTFTALGIGTIMVVAVAMIGSLTVVPGRAGRARRQGREGPRAVPVPPRRARRRRVAHVGRGARPRAARPAISAVAAAAVLLVAGLAGAAACTLVNSGTDGPAAQARRSCRPTTASRPRSRAARSRRSWSQGQGRHDAAGPAAIKPLERRGARHRPLQRPDRRRRQPDRHVAQIVDPDQGRRHRRRLRTPLATLRDEHRRADGRQGARRRRRPT